MEKIEKDKLIKFLYDFIPGGSECLQTAFVGRVMEYLSEKKEFSVDALGDMRTEGDLESVYTDYIIGNRHSFDLPLCGADKGDCGFEAVEGFWFLGNGIEDLLEQMGSSMEEFDKLFHGKNFDYEFCNSESDMFNKQREFLFRKDGLWAQCKSEYPEYFELFPENEMSESMRRSLLSFFIMGVMDDPDCESGLYTQHSIYLNNPAMGKWNYYLSKNKVEIDERRKTRELMESFQSVLNAQSDSCSLLLSTFNKDDALSFYQPYVCTTECRWAYYFCEDSEYYGYRLVDWPIFNLLSPRCVSVMLQIVKFLEEMEEKYHFLSSLEKGGTAA